MPQASFTPYFFAHLNALSVPSITCAFFARVASGAVGGAGSSACRLSQMPLSASSFIVSSSSNWPCSMHFTPASTARRTARGVYACTVT